MQRHYGMDWLRIGAFALLILYHVGMVFVPWGFHAKSTHVAGWLVLPMLGVNAWRLTLLFVVSGYASRALLARSTGAAAFAATRSARLLVPLLVGVVLIVPPQSWVELATQHGYTGSLATFLADDYFRFGSLAGLALPTWNHLWFVGYLWVYTLFLAVLAILPLGRAQAVFDRAMGGWGVLLIPMAWLSCVHGWWFVMSVESHELFGDWVAHANFVPAFLFGVGLAGSPPARAAIARLWPAALAIAIAGYAFILWAELYWPEGTPEPRWVYRPYGIAHAIQQWGGTIALTGIAERFWNRDRPIRATLTEAVFPFYLIHQTIIVVAMYFLLGAGLPGWAEFLALVAATIAGCWLFYLVGRMVGPIRPLIGLRRHDPAPRAQLMKAAAA